ncbi:MAG: hypothetical protein ABJB61_04910 [bacterium]
MNLKLLAESILFRNRLGKVKIQGVDGEKDFTIIDVEDAHGCN